jgi:prepilin-type N-terminal cleavage/methylation domain-containing protein
MEKGFENSQSIETRPDGLASAKPGKQLRSGFSLTELVVTVVIALIVILAVGTVIADGVGGWGKMYETVYSDVRDDSFIARKTFDRVVRNAIRQPVSVDPAGAWVEVYYYSTSSMPIVDRYARFYASRRALILERGTFTPGDIGSKSVLSMEMVCTNVVSCIFKGDGRSAQMILSLNNRTMPRDLVVVTSAVMHNGS